MDKLTFVYYEKETNALWFVISIIYYAINKIMYITRQYNSGSSQRFEATLLLISMCLTDIFTVSKSTKVLLLVIECLHPASKISQTLQDL